MCVCAHVHACVFVFKVLKNKRSFLNMNNSSTVIFRGHGTLLKCSLADTKSSESVIV